MKVTVISQQCIPPDVLTGFSSVLSLFLIMILWLLSVLLICFLALLPSVIVTEQTSPMS